MHSIVSFQIIVFLDIDVKFISKIGRKVITFSEKAKEKQKMFIRYGVFMWKKIL